MEGGCDQRSVMENYEEDHIMDLMKLERTWHGPRVKVLSSNFFLLSHNYLLLIVQLRIIYVLPP